MAKQTFIQRGVAALRGPDGKILQEVKLYEKVTNDITKGEKQIVKDAASLLAEALESRKEEQKLC